MRVILTLDFLKQQVIQWHVQTIKLLIILAVAYVSVCYCILFFHYCVDIKWHLMNDCIPVISKLDANREELEDCPPPRQYPIQLSYQKALPQLSPWQRNEKLLFRY